MSQRFYGWKLTTVLWVIMVLVIGFTSYGGSIMNTYMVTELHLDRTSLGIATGSYAVCMGLFSPLTGYVVSRWGARAALSTGVLLAGLGSLAMATVVSSVAGVVIAYGIIVGSASALAGPIPSNTMIGHWFRKRLALALAIVSTGSSIGGFLAALLLTKVIVASDGNWRSGWFVVAAVCAISFFVSILFTRNKPSDMGQLQDGGADDGLQANDRSRPTPVPLVYKTTKDWIFRDAVRNPVFWMMIFAVAVSTTVWGMMIGHGVAYFKGLGYKPETAAMFLSCLIFSGLGGKAVFAAVGDRIEPRFIWSASLFVIAAGMLMVANATSTLELYACAILLGVTPPVGVLSMFTLTVNYYGKTAYASLMGVTGLFLTLVPAGAGITTGMVFDHFGSYSLAFYTEAGLAILAGLMMPFAIRRETVG
ncbi:MAG: MFS transporter [Thiobacillaceae bacterium]